MAYATAAVVQTVFGKELSTEETALVERRLSQVEGMITRRIPDLAAQIDAGDLDEADVLDIEAEAVLRVIRNPEGYLSEDDGTYQYQFSREAASGKLEILPHEWELLGVKPSRIVPVVPNLVVPAPVSSFWRGG